MLTPLPGLPLGRVIATPATLPAIRFAAEPVGITGMFSDVILSTVIVDLATDWASMLPDTVTWSRRVDVTLRVMFTVIRLSATRRTLLMRCGP